MTARRSTNDVERDRPPLETDNKPSRLRPKERPNVWRRYWSIAKLWPADEARSWPRNRGETFDLKTETRSLRPKTETGRDFNTTGTHFSTRFPWSRRGRWWVRLVRRTAQAWKPRTWLWPSASIRRRPCRRRTRREDDQFPDDDDLHLYVCSRYGTGSQELGHILWPSDPVTRESSDPETQLTRWPCSIMNSKCRLTLQTNVCNGQEVYQFLSLFGVRALLESKILKIIY